MCTSCNSNNKCGCASKTLPIGPAGPQGAAGRNGSNGSNGLPGMAWTTLSWAGYNLDYTGVYNYLECVARSTYSEIPNAHFIYPGTNNAPSITKLLANIWIPVGSASVAKVIVKDLTNGYNVIAEYSVGTNSTTKSNLVDLGIISNLPTTESVFGIFVKTGSSTRGDNAFLGSFLIGSY